MLLPTDHNELIEQSQSLSGLSGDQLAHLASYVCQASVAILIRCVDLETQWIELVGVAGWEPGNDAATLAQELYQVVQGKTGNRAIAAKGIALYPPPLAAAFAANLPAVKCWFAMGIGAIHQPLVGVLALFDTTPRTLQPEQWELLQILAERAAPLVVAPTPSSPSGTHTSSEAIASLPTAQLTTEIEHLHHLQSLSNGLQQCQSMEDVGDRLPTLLSPLLPRTSGRLLLVDLPQTHFKEVIRWGLPPQPDCFQDPNICPVVQQGHRCQCDEGWVLTEGDLATRDRPLLTSDRGHLHTLCSPITIPNGTLVAILSLWGVPPQKTPTQVHQHLDAITQQLSFTLNRIEQIESLQNQSIRDPLTGLFNRRYLAELLPQLLHRASHGNYPVSIIMLDIDHFKQINDQFGHPAGDQVLRDFSLILKGFVRGTDIACRYGGEEFILVLPDLSLHTAKQRAERIRQNLQYLSMRHGKRNLGTITLSAGVACFPDHGITGDDLITAADQALYQAKATGRNRVLVYDDSWENPRTLTQSRNS